MVSSEVFLLLSKAAAETPNKRTPDVVLKIAAVAMRRLKKSVIVATGAARTEYFQ
jgi:hypothetical protein